MKKSNLLKITVLCVFFASFFVEQSMAQGRPDWLAWKWDSWKFVVTGKDIKKDDYYSLRIGIKHTNNSSSKDVTAIYKKTLTFSATVNNNLTWVTNQGKAVKKTITSDKINNIDIWPGNSYTLYYDIPVKDLIPASYGYASHWENYNKDLATQKPGNYFSNTKVTYDCYVKTK